MPVVCMNEHDGMTVGGKNTATCAKQFHDLIRDLTGAQGKSRLDIAMALGMVTEALKEEMPYAKALMAFGQEVYQYSRSVARQNMIESAVESLFQHSPDCEAQADHEEVVQ